MPTKRQSQRCDQTIEQPIKVVSTSSGGGGGGGNNVNNGNTNNSGGGDTMVATVPNDGSSIGDSHTESSLVKNITRDILHKDVQEMLENDLNCAICREIYINPLILNCSHSFCKFCVYRWLSKQSGCPTCRNTVTFQAENLALRNIINKMIQKSSQEFQCVRFNTVTVRLEDEEQQEKDGVVPKMTLKNNSRRTSRGPNRRRNNNRANEERGQPLAEIAHLHSSSLNNNDRRNNQLEGVFPVYGRNFLDVLDGDRAAARVYRFYSELADGDWFGEDDDPYDHDVTFEYSSSDESSESDDNEIDDEDEEDNDEDEDDEMDDDSYEDLDIIGNSDAEEEGSAHELAASDDEEEQNDDEEDDDHGESDGDDEDDFEGGEEIDDGQFFDNDYSSSSSSIDDSIMSDDGDGFEESRSRIVSSSNVLPDTDSDEATTSSDDSTEEYETESDFDEGSMDSVDDIDRYSSATIEYGTSSDESG